MPKGIYSNNKCDNDIDNKFIPNKHQKETLDYFLNSPYKGLLLFHKLGSGKTCTSIIIADEMLKQKKCDKVYILSPGSLRAGWSEEYCKVCGSNEKLYNKYTFITYNYAVGNSIPDFDNSLVIIDEVHNLINGVKNFSKNSLKIYESLEKANCKILALSGTPIYNYLVEFALLGNLLKPDTFPEVRTSDKKISRIAFENLFDIKEDGTLVPKNPTIINRMLDGIISYYPGATKEFVPEIIEMPIIKVTMTEEQEENYWVKFFQEKALDKPPYPALKFKDPARYNLINRLFVMTKKKILTRRASNFFYPPEFNDTPDLPKSQGGWIAKKYFKDDKLSSLYSPKFAAILSNIVLHINQKHVIFTFFKDKAGAYLLKYILAMCGIKAEVFSGDLDDRKRKSLLKNFNSIKNRYGEKIKAMIVTEAGAEGISVLEARHMHILESSSRMSKIVQAIGRVARFRSHINLPPEERNVKVWRYWSIPSNKNLKIKTKIYTKEGEEKQIEVKINKNEYFKAVDEVLHEAGVKNMNGIYSFLDIIKKNSVTSYVEE